MTVPLGAAVPSLTRWGLSSDADLVFRTVATFGPRPARALAIELGLTKGRVETALAELRAHGAAVIVGDAKTQRTPLWAVRPPADVVHSLRSRRLRLVDQAAQARQHNGILQILSTRLADVGLHGPALGGTVADGIRYLATRSLTRARLSELMAQEQHDHLAVNTEQVFTTETRAAGSKLTAAVAATAVRTRVLSPPPADGDTLDKDPTAHLVNGTSFQYREAAATPMKLFVCDRRTALFPVDPLDFDRGYLEISRPEIVDALVTLFEEHWDDAVDPKLHSVPVILLSERERDLVALLAFGHTDVSAARELRISARSVTNVMRALMDRIGVENRFQLGLALGAMRVAVPPSLDLATPPTAALPTATPALPTAAPALPRAS
jgi:DNA-binding CsgD family transcriptional regulator